MATVFIAGAGCSRGTLHGQECLRPPIAKDFVKDLKARVVDWASEYPELRRVVEHLEKTQQHTERTQRHDVGLEELWTCIDLHAKFPEAFRIPWAARGGVVRELKRVLVRIYGRPCDELAEKVTQSDRGTVAEEVARKITEGDTLISFNYDTVIERIVKKLSKKTLLHGKDVKPGAIRFAKPHGSTSWPIGGLEYCVTDGEPMWDSIPEADVKCGVKDPLLLGAVPLKSELVFEVQEYYKSGRVFEVIREQWRTLANAVETAERIVVLGYSFPKEDTYGRFFFREGMGMREKEKELRIDFYSLSDDHKAVQEAIRDVFPAANPICFRGAVTPAAVKALG